MKVTYVSGYTDDELQGNDSVVNARQIYTAILTEAMRRAKRTFLMWKNGSLGWLSGYVTSERLGDYSYSLGGTARLAKGAFGYDSDLMGSTRESLLDMVNWGWPLNS